MLEDAPEFARPMPKGEWTIERDRERLAQMLRDSAKAGQIKLALKMAGRPISDDEAGLGTWAIWMEKA